MSAWTLVETDTNTNKDISSAVSVGARTVVTAGKVGVLVLAQQVAGGGDYSIYMTLTRSAVEYRVIPTTTATAAAALTTIAFSGEVWANAGDVLTVYLDGLAGDTVTPDITVDWFEGAGATMAAIASTDSGVNSAYGQAYVATEYASDARAYSGQVASLVQGGGEAGPLQFSSEALALAPGLDAADLRAAIGMAEANLDDQLAGLPTAAEVADAVWDEALADHDTAGSAGAGLSAAGDPWTTTLPGSYTGAQAGAMMADIWAVDVNDGAADDESNPTEVAYDGPDGAVRVTHTLTPTTRVKS